MTMRKRVYVMLLMVLVTTMAMAQTAQDLLNEANSKYEAGQMEAALELYTQAANKGLAEAQFQVGKMYYLGESGAKDYSSASMWFKRAARQLRSGTDVYESVSPAWLCTCSAQAGRALLERCPRGGRQRRGETLA